SRVQERPARPYPGTLCAGASACPGGKTSSARRAAAAGARGTTSVSLGSAAAERDHGRVITARNEEALQRRAATPLQSNRRKNRLLWHRFVFQHLHGMPR